VWHNFPALIFLPDFKKRSNLTSSSTINVVKNYGIRKVAVQILKEVLKVAESADVKLERVPGIPIALFKAMIKLPTPIAALILKYAISSKGNSRAM
jgi:hypothetical protein